MGGESGLNGPGIPSTPSISPSGSCSYRSHLCSMANSEELEAAGATVESRGDAGWSSDWADWSGHPECALACSCLVAAGAFVSRKLFWVMVVLASATQIFATVDCNSDVRIVVDSRATPSKAL